MTSRNTFPGGKNPGPETAEGYGDFMVLYMEGSAFKRQKGEGTFIIADKSEIELSTKFPLQPKQVLYWVDKQNKDTLHFAMVKWSTKTDETYRVGLSIL